MNYKFQAIQAVRTGDELGEYRGKAGRESGQGAN